MHPKTRERAIRIILAALIGSDLSRRELGELAKSLKEYEFPRDLAQLLYVSLEQLPSAGSDRGEVWRDSEQRLAAYNIVQNRRLPKRVLLQLMRLVTEERANNFGSEATVKQILSEFFNTATDREVKEFMDMLQSPDKSDQYLKGIMRRS